MEYTEVIDFYLDLSLVYLYLAPQQIVTILIEEKQVISVFSIDSTLAFNEQDVGVPYVI
jgi:hypothetical protein